MAKHINLDAGEVPKPNTKCLASAKHRESARKALQIMKFLPELEVRDIQLPKDSKYTCWYLSVIGYPKLPVINFTLQTSGNMNVEFRYMQFVPPKVRDTLQWQTGNWPYARISNKAFSAQEVIQILKNYVPRCRGALRENLLKRGGTSAAEGVIGDILKSLDIKLVQGERPEWLRNSEGSILQLDFYLPLFNIALEIQGPYHYRDLFGKPDRLSRRQENDRFKIKTCLKRGVSMIWMDSAGI